MNNTQFYSLFKWGGRLQAWNKDWNFIQNQLWMRRGLCMKSRGVGGRVKKCGVNMESEGHVPYAIVLDRNIAYNKTN